ncbi:accessory factor associated with RNA polymerase II [Spathaspora passalidarum NRRL Y-27907]|uniref:Accessory factor associated with RNA polymerase II n=1 Tax=Spathaspora passalidarum (strain NRRL Y-27907 / 11-Y1) TaxID=619300 RepID=G3AEZ6_SPAPN|nr:accessory factor associated with RNA polymerase II [Spathaspora passalidarum NRRL Y-27907]EGW34800.1 accessory factor associated with RNA polymerase II [Spathaspora passalidarum NRRL Y-27907]
MSSPLKALHRAITSNEPLVLLKIDGDNKEVTESIKDATHVELDKETYPLDTITNFYNEDKKQDLRAVLFCWIHDKSSIVDYKDACSELGIADFKFLVKTELTTWLNGNSDSCTFIKDEDVSTATSKPDEVVSESTKRKLEDPQLARIGQFEIESIDHNAALRGSKNIDFGYLVSDAKKFIHQLKRSKTATPKSKVTSNKKQPIIIVSPATSALLSLSNIKEFLEDGKFVEPVPTNRPTGGLVTIRHPPSDKLISSASQIMVVDNVDMFNKPEYWDRVIAIFTTGQAWQFSKYKYSKPEELFQKYHGFYFGYHGEASPRQIKDWNVSEIKVDRDKRFRDRMIVRDFWADIDKILVNRGYGK